MLAAAGIPVAPGITLDVRDYDAASEFAAEADEMLAAVQQAGLQYPLFVKPSRAGSSFGVTKVEHEGDAAELAAAVFEASHHDWRVLVEQGIDAREIECAVLCPKAGEAPQASWPGEIVLDKRAEATTSSMIRQQVRELRRKPCGSARKPAGRNSEPRARNRQKSVHRSRRRGLSRVDTFVTADGEVMVNEINTMPGFTPISMYPKAWEATGVSYTDLITTLIEGVLR